MKESNNLSYGAAADAAAVRAAIDTGIGIKKATRYTDIIFGAFQLKGQSSYDNLIESLQQEAGAIQHLAEIILNHKDSEEIFKFAIAFLRPESDAINKKEGDLKELLSEMFGKEPDDCNPAAVDSNNNYMGILFQHDNRIPEEQRLHILNCQVKTQTIEDSELLEYIEVPEEEFHQLKKDFEIADHLEVLTEISTDQDAISNLLLICESLATGLLACKYLSVLISYDDIENEDDEISFKGKLGIIYAKQIDDYLNRRGYNRALFPVGPFRFQELQSSNTSPPWWIRYETLPLVVIIDEHTFLTPEFPNKLKTLGETHENIFVIYVQGDAEVSSHEFGFGLGFEQNSSDTIEDISFKLGYFAYSISDPEHTSDYMKKIFKDAAFKHSHIIADDVDVTEVLKQLRMRRGKSWEGNSSVIQLIEKAISMKKKDFGILYQKDFDFLGRQLIVRNQREEKRRINEDESALEMMNKRIYGLEHVKKTIIDIMNVLKIAEARKNRGLDTGGVNKVMAFTGPPGVGKTTIAQYFAKIMFENNLLPGQKFININASQLKATFVGHTAPKVQSIFENNDAILLDECYSIAASSNGETDIFSQEAIAQLVTEVEKHSQTKLIIFAGYAGAKMKEFLLSNPGLSSRINFYVDFPPYSVDKEMPEIFKTLAQTRDYVIEEGWRDIVVDFFQKREKSVSFGNGREARKLLDHCIYFQASRLEGKALDVYTLKLITRTDIKGAVSKILDSERKIWEEKARTRIGF